MAEINNPQTGQDEISKFIFSDNVVYRCPYCDKVLFLRINKYFDDYVMECNTKSCYFCMRFGNLHEFRDRLNLLEKIRVSQKKIAFAVPPSEI